MIIFSIFFMIGYYIQLTAEDLRVVNVALKIEYSGIIGMLIAFTKFIDEFFKDPIDCLEEIKNLTYWKRHFRHVFYFVYLQ